MNLLSCYKTHSQCEPYFITWSMNIVIANEWVIYILLYFYPPEPSPPVGHLPREDSSCDHQFLARPGCHKRELGAHCVTSSQGDGHGRTEDGLTLPRAPSVLTPHGFSGQHSPLQWQGLRTCDGLTLTRGDIGGCEAHHHTDTIYSDNAL